MTQPTLKSRASAWLKSETRTLTAIQNAYIAMQAKIDAENVADFADAEETLEALASGYVEAGGELDILLAIPTAQTVSTNVFQASAVPGLDTGPLIPLEGEPVALDKLEKRALFDQLKKTFGNQGRGTDQ